MWKDLKVTLYDIFGYLLPGSVALGAFRLCLIGIAGHTTSCDSCLSWIGLAGQTDQILPNHHSTEGWVFLGLIAYYLGHMVQSIGNGFEGLIGMKGGAAEAILGKAREASKWECVRQRFRVIIVGKHWARIHEKLREETEDRINARVAGIFQPLRSTYDTKNDESYKWLYDCCAEVIAQDGSGEQREMYEYREGFYRGSAIALVLLAVGSFVAGGCCKAKLPGSCSIWIYCTLATGSLLAAFLSFRRYGRFSASRVKRTLLGFLVLDKELQQKQEHGPGTSTEP